MPVSSPSRRTGATRSMPAGPSKDMRGLTRKGACDGMEPYLSASEIINWQHPEVAQKAAELARHKNDVVDIARACFEYVRDEIHHSNDFRLNPVTCRASDVLGYKTGFCYAKSHLLAALLRANNIPAGMCYQRLAIVEGRPPFSLHGLNAVYLPEFGWYRVDARGNREGVNAAFTPPRERLAFSVQITGEVDFQEIWPEPLPQVVRILESADTFQEVFENLPDLEVITS